MTSSISSISRSKFWLVVAALLVWSSVAVAGRKRLVVLDFEGPKAEKFHDDVVKLLKKSHTVISTEKWNGAAEELDAAKVTEKNVKKVAKKLKIDGVISGKIEKRRDEYIIRLKLRAGTSGELVGNSIDTKAEGPRLDGKAQGDLKDELIGQIDELDSNKGGGGDDDDEADSKASKKKKHADDDDADADAKPAKKKKGNSDDDDSGDDDSSSKHSAFAKQHDMKGGDKVDDEDKPKKTEKSDKKSKKSDDDEDADAKPKKSEKADKKSKKSDDDDADTKAALSTKHDEDDTPLPKADKKKKDKDKDDSDDSSDDKPKKKVAKKDDDDEGGSVDAGADEGDVDAAEALSPARRAIDVAAGLSFTGRNLGFTYKAGLSSPPPGYKQAIPVAGGMFDATFYPLAFNKKNRAVTSGLGLEILYDKALKINSQKRYLDNNGAGQVANLSTSESRLKVAAVFRYPLGKGDKVTVVGGKLSYQAKTFSILQTLPNGDPTDVPNVAYKMIEPEAFLIYPASPKLNFNASAGFLAVTDTGGMQATSAYGAASVTGFELSAGIDYVITKNVFLRGEGMLQTIGMSFKGNPMSLTNTRDNDPASQDVTAARDTYFGGAVTVGYAY